MTTKQKQKVEFVAVTNITHGNEDGSRVEIQRGEDLADYDISDAQLKHFWAHGAIAVKGSSKDPNTFPGREDRYPTTPALVERALELQALHDEAGVEWPEGLHTQPHEKAPGDPAGLLAGDPTASEFPDAEDEEPEPEAPQE